MASPVPHERTLRKILIASLLPSFPLIVASGVKSSQSDDWYYRYSTYSGPTTIFFGLIPTFLSVITAVLALAAAPPDVFANGKRAFWRAGLWFLIDAFLALGNLAVLLPVWIFEPPRLNAHADWMMLETYATVCLIFNMCIHAYLALYHPAKVVGRALKREGGWGWRTECPHCHGKLGTTVETTGAKREGYSLLRAEQYLDEPEEGEASTAVVRESTDSQV